MKKLLLTAFLFFFSGSAWAADCNGTISESTTSTIYACENDDSLVVNSGVTLSHTVNYQPIDANNHDNVTIDNYGTITNPGTANGRGNTPIDIRNSSNITIYNRSGASMYSQKSGTINMAGSDGDVSIYNEGTIHANGHGAIHNYANAVAGDIYINNSGTIKTTNDDVGSSHTGRHLASVAIEGDSSFTGSFTLVNTGTIEVLGTRALPAIRVNNAYANIITTSGTISGGPEQSNTYAGMDIVVEKCTSTTNYNHCSGKDETTTINLGGEPTFSKGLDLNGTKVNIVLKKDLKKDLTIKIWDYVEESGDYLTITNEGKHTYTISSETLTFGDGSDNLVGSSFDTRDCTSRTFVGQSDSCTIEKYNAGTDGILTITYNQALESVNNNQNYRAENTLTKIRGLFSAANYVGGKWPDHCETVYNEKIDSKINETCNKRFLKAFHSYQKRDGVYDGTSSGIVAMLSPIMWKEFPIVSNVFVGYSNQEGDFNNGEYLGGDNYVLGLKNTYEKKRFKASFTPMIGLNDLDVTDYESYGGQKISTNFLSEFAAINGKIKNKIETGEDRYLNISVEGTFGVQRFPDYISKFTDGDLSVDESIEQLLSGGFEVSYVEGLPGNFVIKPYYGLTLNKNLNDQIKIVADGENKHVTNAGQESWSGYYAGVNLSKEIKGTDFDLDLMYGNEDGLINQIAFISLTKAFGDQINKESSTKEDENIKISNAVLDKNLIEFGELKKLSEQLKTQNEKLKIENKKLKTINSEIIKENKASKRLIVELLKDNEKLKLEKEMFKNKILKIENEQLLKEIEKKVTPNEVNKFVLLLFLLILILIAYTISSFILAILKRSFKS